MNDKEGVKKLKLPKEILDKLQIKENARDSRHRSTTQSRRELRKSARVDKKGRAARARTIRKQQEHHQQRPVANRVKVSHHHVQPAKSSRRVSVSPSTSDAEEDVQEIPSEPSSSDDDSDTHEEPHKISRTAREKLEEDDVEIRRLEKKLGIKGKKRLRTDDSDGLDGILAGLDDAESDNSDANLDAEAQEWLRKKRKASKSRSTNERSDHDVDTVFSGFDESEDEMGAIESLGSEMADENERGQASPAKRASGLSKARENPYLPPVVTGDTALPPTGVRARTILENVDISDQLRRRIKGLLNRLSEANILSILAEVESIYSSNARQHVSTALMDALMFHFDIAGPLEDPFVILHGGFIAGLTKLIGPDFGAETVKRVTDKLESYLQEPENIQTSDKASVNLMILLTELYNFRVISSDLVYDFIREFVNVISEQHTELLLKVVKASGQQLRQEDPSALKDIVLTLQSTASAAGLAKQSVRTRFMVDTIMDLKNNRLKSTLQSSGMAVEHRSRLRKSLGSLPQHKVKTNEPLRINLSDIRNSELKGRWWVVGAKYTDDKPEPIAPVPPTEPEVSESHVEEDGVDVSSLAKHLRINTEVRRAIFVSVMSATDYEDAHQRLRKLHLKKAQEGEVPKVLIQCVTGEQVYNPYYALIASKLCEDKRIRMSFQFTLWDTIKLLAQPLGEDVLEDTPAAPDIKAVVHLAKMYGFLVAEQRLDIKIIKNIEIQDLAEGEVEYVFLEVFLVTVIMHCYRTNGETAAERLKIIFDAANELPDLAQGLGEFLQSNIKGTDMVKKSQRKNLRAGCALAEGWLK